MKKLLNRNQGFTLIELLIVIAIIGVLAAGLFIAINPADKLAQAKDSQVSNTLSESGNSVEGAVSAMSASNYPINGTNAANGAQNATYGAKIAGTCLGYACTLSNGVVMTWVPVPAACNNGATPCTGFRLSSPMGSNKYKNMPYVANGSANSYFVYDSVGGKTCYMTSAPDSTTGCP